MEGRTWDDELVIRQEALKCRACGGTNPYICKCARDAFISLEAMRRDVKKQAPHKRPRIVLSEKEIEDEWIGFKALTCSPSMVICVKCKTGEYESFCSCAKAKWLEWYQNNG